MKADGAETKFGGAWRRYRSGFMPVIGLCFILFLVIIAVCAPIVAPYDPTQINLDQTFVPPSPGHWLGTDYLGRDTLSRIIYGTQVVLTIGVIAALLMTGVGLLMGLASGYFGGLMDQLLMRITDIFLILPALPLILICVAVFGPSVINVILIIGILSWPPLARIVRAETLSVMTRDFISAERTMGARHARIIFRHILPNVLSPIFVYAALGIANAILIEAAVDFLGLAPLSVSWGYDLSIALNYWVRGAWWIAFFPGLFILMTCLSFFLISDGLNKMLKLEQ